MDELKGLEKLFERGRQFDVELEHLMEGIIQTYSFELWKLPIVENVDNFIDERSYYEIHFLTKQDKLRIEMKGAGIPQEKFDKLPKIAFTTKLDEILREKREGLGYFGWGLKATLIVADEIEIETKLGLYNGRQVWFWKGRIPYYDDSEPPVLDLKEDQTVLVYHLNKDYHDKIGESEVVQTLQEFYPTLLAGAPALGVKRRFFVNGKPVPKSDWLNEDRYSDVELLKDLEVDGNSLSGRIFIAQDELPEEVRGVALIVCGRNIINERINLFPDVKRYTGYVHADFFFKDLIGDKTALRKRDNPRFLKFKKIFVNELERILKRKGLLSITPPKDREFLRRVHKVVAEVIREVPELEKYGILGLIKGDVGIYRRGDEEVVEKGIGPSSKTEIPHKDHVRGVDQPGGGGREPIVYPSTEGGEKARRTPGRRKAIPMFIPTELPNNEIEACFEGYKVLINMNHPNYQFSLRTSEWLRQYHILRAGFEAILDNLLDNKEINQERYMELKKKVMFSLGNAL